MDRSYLEKKKKIYQERFYLGKKGKAPSCSEKGRKREVGYFKPLFSRARIRQRREGEGRRFGEKEGFRNRADAHVLLVSKKGRRLSAEKGERGRVLWATGRNRKGKPVPGNFGELDSRKEGSKKGKIGS